ncbi:MAG TPA: DUF4296 domain-containing protein [Flavisolibacter sp.]|jgi:hypothetical protein|nr:DUF4296 domain-containing protein [Flavisolibacter sp.]
MIKKLSVIIIILFAVACNKKEKIPEYVLSPLQMQQILIDGFRADEMAGYYMIQDTSYNGIAKRSMMYNTIFKVHHVTKEQFKKSLQYYESHPNMLKAVLDSMQIVTDSTIKHTKPSPAKPSPAKPSKPIP